MVQRQVNVNDMCGPGSESGGAGSVNKVFVQGNSAILFIEHCTVAAVLLECDTHSCYAVERPFRTPRVDANLCEYKYHFTQLYQPCKPPTINPYGRAEATRPVPLPPLPCLCAASTCFVEVATRRQHTCDTLRHCSQRCYRVWLALAVFLPFPAPWCPCRQTA